jgi:hypothetical protein
VPTLPWTALFGVSSDKAGFQAEGLIRNARFLRGEFTCGFTAEVIRFITQLQYLSFSLSLNLDSSVVADSTAEGS